ncbi:hypothetical protein FJZ26_00785 [Candidatus Parvarchaeota archaeon]|nr:hypothetical protein [Candidatus Parvarchaeota archaeon]
MVEKEFVRRGLLAVSVAFLIASVLLAALPFEKWGAKKNRVLFGQGEGTGFERTGLAANGKGNANVAELSALLLPNGTGVITKYGLSPNQIGNLEQSAEFKAQMAGPNNSFFVSSGGVDALVAKNLNESQAINLAGSKLIEAMLGGSLEKNTSLAGLVANGTWAQELPNLGQNPGGFDIGVGGPGSGKFGLEAQTGNYSRTETFSINGASFQAIVPNSMGFDQAASIVNTGQFARAYARMAGTQDSELFAYRDPASNQTLLIPMNIPDLQGSGLLSSNFWPSLGAASLPAGLPIATSQLPGLKAAGVGLPIMPNLAAKPSMPSYDSKSGKPRDISELPPLPIDGGDVLSMMQLAAGAIGVGILLWAILKNHRAGGRKQSEPEGRKATGELTYGDSPGRFKTPLGSSQDSQEIEASPFFVVRILNNYIARGVKVSLEIENRSKEPIDNVSLSDRQEQLAQVGSIGPNETKAAEFEVKEGEANSMTVYINFEPSYVDGKLISQSSFELPLKKL